MVIRLLLLVRSAVLEAVRGNRQRRGPVEVGVELSAISSSVTGPVVGVPGPVAAVSDPVVVVESRVAARPFRADRILDIRGALTR